MAEKTKYQARQRQIRAQFRPEHLRPRGFTCRLTWPDPLTDNTTSDRGGERGGERDGKGG